MTAAHQWLDLRVPFDDAARQQSLPLLDRVAATLREESTGRPQPVTAIDIGAGTGNSAHWFQKHLTPRLPGHDLQWALVDTDRAALHTASSLLPGVQTFTAEIAQLPQLADDIMKPTPGKLLLTGSAVLDVFTQEDLHAIIDTLSRHGGVGMVLLSITGKWRLTPAEDHDDVVNEAFCGHQQRHGKLGPTAPQVFADLARQAGASVATSRSSWQLTAPQDQAFLTRFLSERVQAAIEHRPELERLARKWLWRRLEQAAKALVVEIEHLDVAVDARSGR